MRIIAIVMLLMMFSAQRFSADANKLDFSGFTVVAPAASEPYIIYCKRDGLIFDKTIFEKEVTSHKMVPRGDKIMVKYKSTDPKDSGLFFAPKGSWCDAED
jgi:hypothetical protein